MAIQMRRYRPDPLFGEDYASLRRFLIELDSPNWPFGRWDWLVTHRLLERSWLGRIGLWEEEGRIVAAVLHDTVPGRAYLLMHDTQRPLAPQLIAHAEEAFGVDGRVQLLIRDGDLEVQTAALRQGYHAGQDGEQDAIHCLDPRDLDYRLPEGYRISTLGEEMRLHELGQLMWRSFNLESRGIGPYVADEASWRSTEAQLIRPNVNLDLKVIILSPDDRLVAFCGCWCEPGVRHALVEPVAVDPDVQGLGLGRAVVCEALRRCRALGAEAAFVGSTLPFYYRIGFRPYATWSWWEKAK